MINQYIEELSPYGYSGRTLNEYRGHLMAVQRFLGVQLDRVRRADVVRYVARSGLAPATINIRLTILKKFYNWAVEHGLMESNPVDGVRKVKTAQRLPKFFGKEDIANLLNGLKGETPKDRRDALLINTLYYTGMRIGEVASLRWDHINFNSNTIRIIGKGNKERLIPVHPTLMKSLKRWEEEAREYNCSTRHVFIGFAKGNEGARLSYDQCRHVVKETLTWHGYDNMNPHTLRHTFATSLLREDANLAQIQALLGHQDIKTTMRYAHVDEVTLRGAVGRI